MKKAILIICTGVVVLSALIATLLWSGIAYYELEKKKISAHIEELATACATRIQNDNLTLNNQLASYYDKEGQEKQAFAMGITGNMGKVQINFGEQENDEEDKAGVFNVTFDTLKKMNIQFIPKAVKTISDYTALLSDTLKAETLPVRFVPVFAKSGSEFSFSKDSSKYEYHTRPLILNYYEPDVFRVNYNVPAGFVYKQMWLFMAAGLLSIFILAAAFIMYYRSFTLQVQMSSFKENLFSNITHELKTPLSSLQLIVDSAQDNPGKPLSAEHLAFATDELNRMKLIIEKILSFNKLNREQVALNKESADIQTIIAEALNAMSMHIQNAGATVNYDNSIGNIIAADKTLLVNMFATIIDNALKYNTGKPEIYIHTAVAGDKLIISIADNGIGIPSVYHKKVFEPFFRIPTGDVHNVKGHGIGLSFARQVAQLHGGNIIVKANEPKGSIFIITLSS